MPQRIKAGFGDLDGLVTRIDNTTEEVQSELDTLTAAIAKLADEWEGAAADGFQQKIHQWRTAAQDLRTALRRLGTIVHTTNANYQNALATNTGMWPAR
ncbi:MAG TPA: WXG100 family type VII secretion target [Pseudonocardiaceae bacterium]|jgi:early secretory antigenic target protein ESAT-6|nr:WXG100 family type VII secretion target [Pseudonocardiaceae bacterium]